MAKLLKIVRYVCSKCTQVSKTPFSVCPGCCLTLKIEKDAKEIAIKKLFKWWNDYGGKLPVKQYEKLGNILERLA